ncbi:MAG: aminodeoxychorismate synthase component I [Alphaproteobacteria bacterium]|nr:aminodeoxychorismate synthase component I [Alphaproteobacteria bacterium]
MTPPLARRASCRLSLPWRDPVTAFAPLEAQAYSLLLHDGRSGRARLFATPSDVFEGASRAAFDVFAKAFRQAPEVMWAGLFGYDLAGAFESLPSWSDKPVALNMAAYSCWAEFDHDRGEIFIHARNDSEARAFADRLGQDALAAARPAARAEWRNNWSAETYLKAAQSARDYVHAGDVFQVNLSQRFNCTLGQSDTPFEVFRRLCEGSPAPHAAYLRLSDDKVVMTNSPERFIAVRNGQIEARPIKGTRKRDADPGRDNTLKAELAASLKDRAENLMIVDLMRNDLARVCAAGSVEVPLLCEIETYANVHHLVSQVLGQLGPGHDLVDLLEASFPPGSITGAPKVRAMEIISELEAEPRGAYCGALGWMSDQAMDLNVMIRTATLRRVDGCWEAEVRSGGGIVADSDPQAEYEETLTKASALRAALGGAQ